MPTATISEDSFELLTDILTAATELDAKLTPWEHEFVTDLSTRVEKWGRKVRVSPRQWEILRRIQGKL